MNMSMHYSAQWQSGEISEYGNTILPNEPSRTELTVVAPGKEPKRGKGGSLVSEIFASGNLNSQDLGL